MKITTIIIILFLFVVKVCAQNNPFGTDKKKDSLWIKQLIEIEKGNQLENSKKDPSVVMANWISGKIVYSPDSCLRIVQISTRYEGSNSTFYSTNVQYFNQNKVLELKLPADTNSYDFQDYSVTDIYKIPGPQATYLIISADKQKLVDQITESAYDVYSDNSLDKKIRNIENMYNSASLVHIAGDSLKEIAFKAEPFEQDWKTRDIISGNSIYFKSYVKTAKYSPKPFLKYNPAKKEITFLTTYYDNEDTYIGRNVPYLNVYAGTLKYQDSAFTLTSDTAYFYPSLKSLNKIIAAKQFKTGKYVTHGFATRKYEEVGEGVLSILYVDYKIRSQSIGYIDYTFDNSSVRDIKPEYKVLNNSSLIFLVTDLTTPNQIGMCGGCQYYDSSFWLINANSKKLLFSFSSNSQTLYTTYTYNNGKSDVSGRFYLEKSFDGDENEMTSNVEKAYWKNNNTYVFHVSDETAYRDFYVRFITVNNKTIAKLSVGKLVHK